MNLYILLISLLFFAPAKGQFTTNVYWTETSEMAPSNTIYYNPQENLKWSDFLGTPGPAGPVAAMTTSGFGYKAGMKTIGNKGEINVSVYCYFIKDKSWVKPGRTTLYILNHEQHHFDVSFIVAGIFIQKIKAAGLTAANCNTILPKLYRECCDLMYKMQDDYDGQSRNGQDHEGQEKWNNFFNEKVPLVTR